MNGTVLDGNSIEGIEGNLFALHDVDGDGAAELILLWQNAMMAAIRARLKKYRDMEV